MSKVIIKDDDMFELLDYLIKQDNSYAEYLAEKLFIAAGLQGKYETYAKVILKKAND